MIGLTTIGAALALGGLSLRTPKFQRFTPSNSYCNFYGGCTIDS